MSFSNEERIKINLPRKNYDKHNESDNISYNHLLSIVMDFKIYLSKI